jgi:phage gp36-like protein
VAYADADDLVYRFDERVIKDLLSDDRSPVESLHGNLRIEAALDDASGRIDGALQVGGQYTTDDLEGLTSNSLALMKRITCELAMAYLLSRRPELFGGQRYEALQKSSEEYLERLRRGDRLFASSAEHVAAGLPSVDGPTATDYNRLNLLPDRTQRYYPSRSSRLPIGRGN